ncbi:MAG: DUF364 domain-containing protein [Candidatus Cloacimonadota bacterium]|nr:DUF364 domain-containing protein [Candidatus Cloacimonadota bacterium]
MKKAQPDPLQFLLDKYSLDIGKIDQISCGAKYSAVMLTNGNIGVCANLRSKISLKKHDLKIPDMNNFHHRILLTAYFNALLNYSNQYDNGGDMFELIDFSQYKSLVMIGLFYPIVRKLQNAGIPINIFDLNKTDEILTPISEQKKYLKKADAIILTGTAIFNKTFVDLIRNTNSNCEIFMLGPSSIMHQKILEYKNMKFIFGSVFKKYDERILEIIRNGGGTQRFLKFGRKVFISKNG